MMFLLGGGLAGKIMFSLYLCYSCIGNSGNRAVPPITQGSVTTVTTRGLLHHHHHYKGASSIGKSMGISMSIIIGMDLKQ